MPATGQQYGTKSLEEEKDTTINAIAPLANPAHAMHKGQPVRVIALGDREGFSPVALVVYADGRSQWQSQAEVEFIDPNYLPIKVQGQTAR